MRKHTMKRGWCFVSGCMNRQTYKKSKKAFFSVPSGEDRKEWIKLCGSKSRSRKRSRVICEDHFTLEKDLENYWQFMNSERLGLPPVKGKLKKGVLPTKFIFHPDKEGNDGIHATSFLCQNISLPESDTEIGATVPLSVKPSSSQSWTTSSSSSTGSNSCWSRETSFLESAVPFLSILVEDGMKSSSTAIGHSIDASNDDLVTSPCPNSLSDYLNEFTGNMEISVPERPASPDQPKLRILTPNDININSAESTTFTDNVTAAENTDSTEIATGVQIKIEQDDPFNGSEAIQFIDCSGLVKSEVTDDELHSKISIKAKPEELRFAETVTSLSETPETSLKEEQPVEYDCGRGFVCDFCDERFYLKRTLNNHMNKHAKEFYGEIEEDSIYDSMDTETSEYDDDSSYVEKSSESSEDEYSSVVITTNSAEIPADGKLFICSKCTRRYTSAELLERHVCRPVEKRFGCAHCNRHYRNRQYLVDHLKTHTNERPFSCSHCGSTFKVKTRLTSHIRISCKLLVCRYCQKRFRTENERDQHLRKAHIPN